MKPTVDQAARGAVWGRVQPFLWLVLYAVISLALAVVGTTRARPSMREERGVFAMVQRTAFRPYVSRQLAPAVIRLLLSVRTPEQWRERMQGLIDSGAIERYDQWAAGLGRWRAEEMAALFASALINWLCLIAFAYVFRALLRSQYAAPPLFFHLVPAFALYFLRFMIREGIYVYDFPGILLFALGLLLLSRNAWWGYYPVFVLGLLNKETMIVLGLAYAVYQFGRLPRKAYWAHGAAQLALFAAIKAIFDHAFRNHGGHVVEHHFLDHNIRQMVDAPPVADLAIGLILLALLLYAWRQQPLFLRRAAVVFWPLFALALLFGWMEELRDYYEFYPVGLALMSATAAKVVLRVPVTARADELRL
jgi:hypothetical protein